ncbi:hypothetical protein ACFVOK_37455 [Streptomyces sp. NPDC057798]|uniref:hypothetical protein n=1 Tax=Streptomyces sp. NPDC057798 TaxID=3346252 RepID=UPI0036888D00
MKTDSSRKTRRLRWYAVMSVVGMAVASLMVSSQTANPASGPSRTATASTPTDITCLIGNRHTHFSPPLTNTPRPTQLDITETLHCTSLSSSVRSGRADYSLSIPQTSCLLSLQDPFTQRTVLYRWNTGQTSTVTFETSTSARAADGSIVITSTGKVTSGLATGQPATRATTEANLGLLACATTGIEETNSTTHTLVIAPL